MDTHIAQVQSLLREMHLNQKGFIDTIVSAQPRISSRLAKIEDTLAADAAVRKTNNRVAGDAIRALESQVGGTVIVIRGWARSLTTDCRPSGQD